MITTDNSRAALLMVGSMAAFAIEDLFLKRAATQLPPGEVIALTGAAGALAFWALAARQGQSIISPMALRGAPLLRSLSEAGASMLYIVALALAPLTMTSALLQASPLVVTAGAALFLGETVGWRRWISIAVGFLGVMIILNPWDTQFDTTGLLTVACVIVLAGRDLSTRAMPATIGTFQLAAWAYIAMIPAGIVLMVLMGDTAAMPDPGRWLDLGLALITGLVGYYAVTQAMRVGEVSAVVPFRYSRLVFSITLAILFLGERPQTTTMIGAAIVVGSGLYAFARERARKAALSQSRKAR